MNLKKITKYGFISWLNIFHKYTVYRYEHLHSELFIKEQERDQQSCHLMHGEDGTWSGKNWASDCQTNWIIYDAQLQQKQKKTSTLRHWRSVIITLNTMPIKYLFQLITLLHVETWRTVIQRKYVFSGNHRYKAAKQWSSVQHGWVWFWS